MKEICCLKNTQHTVNDIDIIDIQKMDHNSLNNKYIPK